MRGFSTPTKQNLADIHEALRMEAARSFARGFARSFA